MNQSIPDDEDEQLRIAIALSLQEVQIDNAAASTQGVGASNADVDDGTTHAPTSKVTKSDDRSPSGLLGLDRRAMEEARLARHARTSVNLASHVDGPPSTRVSRKRDVSPDPNAVAQDAARSKRLRQDQVPVDHRSDPLNATPKLAPQVEGPRPHLYPQGVIKQTWCLGFERSTQDVKLEEVLQKDTLQLAVLSSFIWDVEWVLAKLKQSTKVVLVMSVKGEDARVHFTRQANETKGRQIRTCFPPMPGNVNCMHSKLMLLAHPTHLRVVVPTANLVPFDWGETGVMENSLFMIDLPRRPSKESRKVESLTSFGVELHRFCTAMGLDSELVNSLGKFDYSATTNLAFVHTIGGEHRLAKHWQRTGYPGLGTAVQELGLRTEDPICIDYVASSLGAINSDLLEMLYLACKGDDGLTEFKHRTDHSKRSVKSTSRYEKTQLARDHTSLQNGFRIYFPSEETVRDSKGGRENGGTICFQERWFASEKFEKSILRDCQSVREGLLMHNKMILVHRAQPAATRTLDSGDQGAAWVYLGSANCSESAWGRLVKDRSSQKPKLTCRNWECGIIMQIPQESGVVVSPATRPSSVNGLEQLQDKIHIPMRLPARSYADTNARPWFFME